MAGQTLTIFKTWILHVHVCQLKQDWLWSYDILHEDAALDCSKIFSIHLPKY